MHPSGSEDPLLESIRDRWEAEKSNAPAPTLRDVHRFPEPDEQPDPRAQWDEVGGVWQIWNDQTQVWEPVGVPLADRESVSTVPAPGEDGGGPVLGTPDVHRFPEPDDQPDPHAHWDEIRGVWEVWNDGTQVWDEIGLPLDAAAGIPDGTTLGSSGALEPASPSVAGAVSAVAPLALGPSAAAAGQPEPPVVPEPPVLPEPPVVGEPPTPPVVPPVVEPPVAPPPPAAIAPASSAEPPSAPFADIYGARLGQPIVAPLGSSGPGSLNPGGLRYPEPSERPSPDAKWDEYAGAWTRWDADKGAWIPWAEPAAD